MSYRQERAAGFTHALGSYQSHLNSNDALPDADATYIEHNLLRGIQAEELLVEQEIAFLQAQLADLQHDKDTFSHLGDACRKLLSPIRRLPPDVLLEVYKFRFQEDSVDDDGRYRLFQIDDGPWVFSHVCAAWRHAMLSFPSVWASFFIDSVAPVKHYRFYLELALVRSQSHPLNFAFKWPHHIGFRIVWNELLAALMPCSSRWETAILTLDDAATDILLGSRLTASPTFESLKQIDLTFHNSYIRPIKEAPDNLECMLLDAPKLVDARIQGQRRHTRMLLPWNRLQHLAIKTSYEQMRRDEGVGFSQLYRDMRLVNLCPSLISFDLSYIKSWSEVSMDSGMMITHNTLSSLTISDTALLRHFRFPSLASLSIKPATLSMMEKMMIRHISDFLEVHTIVQKLFIRNVNGDTPNHFCSMLKDSITELHMDYRSPFDRRDDFAYWSQIFEKLVDSEDTVLPALDTFKGWTSSSPSRVLWQAMARFIESRWVLPLPPNVVRLKRFVFTVEDTRGYLMAIDDDTREMYQRFKKEGLDMEIWAKTWYPRPNAPTKTRLSSGAEGWQYHFP